MYLWIKLEREIWEVYFFFQGNENNENKKVKIICNSQSAVANNKLIFYNRT